MNKIKIGLYSLAVSAFFFILRYILIEARVGYYAPEETFLGIRGYQPQYHVLIIVGALAAAVGIFFLLWVLVTRQRKLPKQAKKVQSSAKEITAKVSRWAIIACLILIAIIAILLIYCAVTGLI